MLTADELKSIRAEYIADQNSYHVWEKYKDNVEALLYLNYLWWTIPTEEWSHNIFGSDANPSAILRENPNAQAIIDLNSYLITIDSQDDSSQNAPLDQEIWDYQIPYIQFYIPKATADNLIKNLDPNFDDLLLIKRKTDKGTSNFFNDALKNTELIDDRIPLTWRMRGSDPKQNRDLTGRAERNGLVMYTAHPIEMDIAAQSTNSEKPLFKYLMDKYFDTGIVVSSRKPARGVRDDLIGRFLKLIQKYSASYLQTDANIIRLYRLVSLPK